VVPLLQQEVDHAVAQRRPPLLRGDARRLHVCWVLSDPELRRPRLLYLNRSRFEETSGGPTAACGSTAGDLAQATRAGGTGRKGKIAIREEPRNATRGVRFGRSAGGSSDEGFVDKGRDRYLQLFFFSLSIGVGGPWSY
jgi:hypothetical protein